MRSTGMSDDCKFKTSKYMYIGPHRKLLRVNLHIGIKICLDIGNKRYMLEQCWNVEKYIPKMCKKYIATFFAQRDLQHYGQRLKYKTIMLQD
jgi:hypothetical protein